MGASGLAPGKSGRPDEESHAEEGGAAADATAPPSIGALMDEEPRTRAVSAPAADLAAGQSTDCAPRFGGISPNEAESQKAAAGAGTTGAAPQNGA